MFIGMVNDLVRHRKRQYRLSVIDVCHIFLHFNRASYQDLPYKGRRIIE